MRGLRLGAFLGSGLSWGRGVGYVTLRRLGSSRARWRQLKSNCLAYSWGQGAEGGAGEGGAGGGRPAPGNEAKR